MSLETFKQKSLGKTCAPIETCLLTVFGEDISYISFV